MEHLDRYENRFLPALIMILSLSLDTSHCFIESSFVKKGICDVGMRIYHGCSQHATEEGRGLFACSSICAADASCIGASVDRSGDCFIHRQCPDVMDCSDEESEHVYVEKRCHNGGVWDGVSSRCQCVDGWVGPACQDYPTKCSDLLEAQYPIATHKTKLDFWNDGTYLIPVLCDVRGTYVDTLVLANAGQESFNKTWAEYQYGFYIDQRHYWIGLEHMHVIQSNDNSISLTNKLIFKNGWEATRDYINVRLRAELFNYAISYDYSELTSVMRNGTALGDCLTDAKLNGFSTWDKDNDANHASNCASALGSGWWYGSSCSMACNLMGWGVEYKSRVPSLSVISITGVDVSRYEVDLVLITMQMEEPQISSIGLT